MDDWGKWRFVKTRLSQERNQFLVISLAGRFPTVIERLSMLKLPEAIFGTWQNDAARTLAEIKRHLRPDHPKLHEFTLPERLIPLTVCYTPDSVLYTYRGEQVRARFRILACDEFSLVSEVETTWLNDQPLWHIHFLSENCYWVTVDLDWGFIYREFFIKVSGSPTIQAAGIESVDREVAAKN